MSYCELHFEFNPIICAEESTVRQPEEQAENVYIPIAGEP
jgi:hypothetical protein